MAKKKKRKKKYRRRAAVPISGTNRHHLLWERSRYVKHEWANKLRNHQFCIVEMLVGEHRLIHERMRLVPVPSESACKGAYEAIEDLWERGTICEQTPLETRLEVLICLLDYVADDSASALKKQLAIVQNIRGG